MEMDRAYFKETRRCHRNDALEWNPQGDRELERPKKTWRRSVNKELG
jgi:hypothetical protein